MGESNSEIKQKTLELYAQLPMDIEERKKCISIRDKIFTLNYNFFKYIAFHTFLSNSSYASPEDKLQSACTAFLEIWWKYKYTPKYRDDISFSVFFGPRIMEMIKREFSEVKYSTRRNLCMKLGDQVNKHWGSVTYDDLKSPNLTLSPKEVDALKAIFGSVYPADLSEVEPYIEAGNEQSIDYLTDKYDSLQDFLIQEMIRTESKLTDANLLKLEEIFGINYLEMKKTLSGAEAALYKNLTDNLDILESF